MIASALVKSSSRLLARLKVRQPIRGRRANCLRSHRRIRLPPRCCIRIEGSGPFSGHRQWRPGHTDVQIAEEAASAVGLKMFLFDPATVWDTEINDALRRAFVWRTSGELRFTEIYHQYLTRPVLSRDYRLHMIGSGGELLRYFPWSQEFLGIGRHRLANIQRTIQYRFLQSTNLQNLAPGNWLKWYQDRLASEIEDVCKEVSGADTTQQLDAVYVWKMTSHGTHTLVYFLI